MLYEFELLTQMTAGDDEDEDEDEDMDEESEKETDDGPEMGTATNDENGDDAEF